MASGLAVRRPMNVYSLLRTARRETPGVLLTYMVAAAAGYAAMRLHVPLPWMMGALLATAAQALSGRRPPVLSAGRRLGQMMIGIGVGLTFSREAALAVLGNLPAMTAAALLTMAAGVAIAQLLARMTGVDRLTAVMSSVPGGPADMANLAERYGGDPLTVALAQTFRIALIVTCIPPAMILAGITGHEDANAAAAIPFSLFGLTVLTVAAAVAIVVLNRLGLANAWFLAPLLLIGGLTAGGVRLSGMPFELVAIAQVLLGVSLGTTFDRRFLMRSPRLLVATIVCSVLLLAGCGGIAALLSKLTGLPLASLAVALAPGGLPEMVLTAKVLHLGVPMVTAFHVERVVLTLILAPHIVAAVAWLTRRPRVEAVSGSAD
jgi:membrane AbrB-like protein